MKEQRISGCRTTYAGHPEILATEQVGRYTVEVYRHYDGTLLYRVRVGDRELRCFTRSEEHHFPLRAARAGSRMVMKMRSRENETQKEA